MHIMGNPCGKSRCKDTTCDWCRFYSPTILGIRVPKRIGNLGFKFEAWLCYRKIERERDKMTAKAAAIKASISKDILGGHCSEQ